MTSDRGLSLLEIAALWGMSRQRVHELVKEIPAAEPGTGGRAHGARYSREQLRELATGRRALVAETLEEWDRRITVLCGDEG